ncbi:hypothetical protein KEJ25_01910 [Candidatus Bathyarchaeota archaeon]|nr:hypothetical protein [Candidatus Bathyarchaeota archaeon]
MSILAEELSEAVRKAEEEEGGLQRANIRELEEKLQEREIEGLKTALMVKETLKVEVKPVEVKLPEIRLPSLAPPTVQLPKVVEGLDADAKQV